MISEKDDIIGHVTLQTAADDPKYKNFHVTVYYNRVDGPGGYATFLDQCSTYFNFDGEIERTRRGNDARGDLKNMCVSSSDVNETFRNRVSAYTTELARKFVALLSVMTYTEERRRGTNRPTTSKEITLHVNTSKGYSRHAAIQPLSSHIVHSEFAPPTFFSGVGGQRAHPRPKA